MYCWMIKGTNERRLRVLNEWMDEEIEEWMNAWLNDWAKEEINDLINRWFKYTDNHISKLSSKFPSIFHRLHVVSKNALTRTKEMTADDVISILKVIIHWYFYFLP